MKELQALPLSRKIQITQTRIIEWYEHYNGQVCVSFSGGKDSTVLLHIARRLYPDIPAVFSNTGLEYASIQRFVKTWDNVDIVTPKMRFDEVVSTYGYPLIGKEVAEAIYYARRLSSQSRNVERERERKQRELRGERRTSYRATGETGGWGEPAPHPDERIEEQKDSPHRENAGERTSRGSERPGRAGVVDITSRGGYAAGRSLRGASRRTRESTDSEEPG